MARRTSWMTLASDAWMLTFEASTVIGLRTLKLAAGGTDAQAEASRMVAEKIDTAMALQAEALTGGLGFTPMASAGIVIKRYRRKVRANRKRLGGG
jgi:hypothetical protein